MTILCSNNTNTYTYGARCQLVHPSVCYPLFLSKRLSTFLLPRTSYVLDHYLYLDFWWNFALSAACFCFFLPLSSHGSKAKTKREKKGLTGPRNATPGLLVLLLNCTYPSSTRDYPLERAPLHSCLTPSPWVIASTYLAYAHTHTHTHSKRTWTYLGALSSMRFYLP